MKKKIHRKKLFKQLLIISLLTNLIEYDDYFKYVKINNLKNDSSLKIFVMTHKDFRNFRYNQVYNIVVDEKSQLKNTYNLKTFYANQGKLYNMKKAYGEMSKLYYIYQLYTEGKITSKFIGLNDYKSYFNFTDNIPDLESIFKNYDIILNPPHIKRRGMRSQFCRYHICQTYDEILNIIKDIKPDFYETAVNTSKEQKIFFCNLFIMKTKDFLEYCKFIYEVLFEFDRRNNLTSDDDVLIYIKKHYGIEKFYDYQSRLHGFLAERLSNIFYYHHFKKIKSIDIVRYINPLDVKDYFFQKQTYIKKQMLYKNLENILFSMKINIFLLFYLAHFFI